MPKREQNSNKGTFGKVLNFAGSKNYIGASYLSTIAPQMEPETSWKRFVQKIRK